MTAVEKQAELEKLNLAIQELKVDIHDRTSKLADLKAARAALKKIEAPKAE